MKIQMQTQIQKNHVQRTWICSSACCLWCHCTDSMSLIGTNAQNYMYIGINELNLKKLPFLAHHHLLTQTQLQMQTQIKIQGQIELM